MKSPCVLILLFLLGLSPCVGCGPSGPTTVPVSGKVTLDGAPVAEGDIYFRDAEGKGGSYAGKIVNGEYTFESTPGPKTVEIRATREVPGKFDESNPGEKVPLIEQYIPPQYNSETTLKAEVAESGENVHNFDLQSGS